MIPTKSFSLIFSFLFAFAGLAAFAAGPPLEEPESGAVVEEVAPSSALDKAGIRPGDLLLSWSRGEEGGDVRSPFDLYRLEVEQAPRGAVTLRGSREGGSQEWTLPPGSWRSRLRPTFPAALLALYRRGLDHFAAGELEAGTGPWRSAIEAAGRRNDPLRAAWLQGCLARELANAGRWPESDAASEGAVQRLKEDHAAALAQLLRDWSERLQRRNLWDRAAELHRRALALEPAESLSAAWDLSSLGTIASRRGDLTAAGDFFVRAQEIREKLAPGSLAVAAGERNLATVKARRGDLDGAEELFLKALEIQQRLDPGGFEGSAVLGNLANVAMIRGDLSTAEERFRHALAGMERLNPDSPELATLLSNLGVAEMYRGELAVAEEHFRRSLAIRKKLAPESIDVASNLNNLGILAEKRGDDAAAEEHHRLALAIREKLAPDSLDLSQSFYNLALVEDRRGNLAKADQYSARALEIQEKIAPEGYDTTATYIYRAMLAVDRGNLTLAESLHGHALAILEKQSPDSLLVSDSLESLGGIAFKRGDLAKAEELLRRALTIREKLAPGSTREGLALNGLGKVYRQAGRLSEAAEYLCRATAAFDRQREKAGGTNEGRSAFAGTVVEHYHDCVSILVDLGRSQEAFGALERGRARSFLDLLAQRDLRLSELPPDLARDRRQVDTDYDRAQKALSRLSPARDQAEIDRLAVRLRELQARQEEIAAKVRLASPRTAALRNPQPLSLPDTRAALDPGTVLLEYAVGAESTWLFVVQSPDSAGSGLSVFRIAAGEKALRKEVESFRDLLGRPGSDRVALQARARRLYGLLVRPAERRITGARRLLVSPDGPLHTLPFAALRRGDRYLVEWKPIHSVLSATVYAELKRSRPAQQDLRRERLTAFGDPTYPRSTPGAPANPEVREVLRRGWTLKPLPSTRKEVESIAALYPHTQVYLGGEATEERAKALGPKSRLIHFACHGLLDERFPLNSALALTLPEHPARGQDNGLLQAWEIFESVRLDADLVTLSACDTALGKESGGEGLVGLTRAFQYAGARSVLASLWGVADYSTARFMKSFYGYLRAGKPKDEALRATQIAQIRKESGSSHPFFWAAFELSGDWR